MSWHFFVVAVYSLQSDWTTVYVMPVCKESHNRTRSKTMGSTFNHICFHIHIEMTGQFRFFLFHFESKKNPIQWACCVWNWRTALAARTLFNRIAQTQISSTWNKNRWPSINEHDNTKPCSIQTFSFLHMNEKTKRDLKNIYVLEYKIRLSLGLFWDGFVKVVHYICNILVAPSILFSPSPLDTVINNYI